MLNRTVFSVRALGPEKLGPKIDSFLLGMRAMFMHHLVAERACDGARLLSSLQDEQKTHHLRLWEMFLGFSLLHRNRF